MHQVSPRFGSHPDPTAVISTRGLTKTYRAETGVGVTALEPLSFDIMEGEFVCLVGPSGCGKSTLLKILAGVIAHTHGEILIAGANPGDRANVGLVFQAPVLLPWRTVLQNTMLPADVLDLDRKTAEKRARQLIDMVGLAGFENSSPPQLSGGMQQRCSITRALLHNPAILLMDEPFGALDAMTRDMMNIELQRIWSESRKTVFLITHSIPEAVFLADRVLVMSQRPGTIIDDIAIDIPRPRRLEAMSSTAFGEYARQIRMHLELEVMDRPHAD